LLTGAAVDRDEVDRLRKRFMKLDKVGSERRPRGKKGMALEIFAG
jgi:hypothetical protein